VNTRVLSTIHDVTAAEWDRLVGDDDPFVEHAFLSTLEDSGSVGGESGWQPRHLTLWEEERLVGAAPMYRKTHSYGEFIFDWAWADAAARTGIEYFPKLVSMVPVTPATGRRLLWAPEQDRAVVCEHLMNASVDLAREEGASSVHWLFLRDEELALTVESQGFMRRLSQQFHWHNDGYSDFDDYLRSFRSSMRKQVRRERRRALGAGLELGVDTGKELSEADWQALYVMYRVGCARYGSPDYLTEKFFVLAKERLAHRIVVATARRDGEIVAASIAFEKGACLFGRYWGCLEDLDCMHFELCYYRLIERAITKGMSRFEAGAQGEHKLRRGMLPTAIHSLHWIDDERLRGAVADFLPREAFMHLKRMDSYREHGPFRRDQCEEPGGS